MRCWQLGGGFPSVDPDWLLRFAAVQGAKEIVSILEKLGEDGAEEPTSVRQRSGSADPRGFVSPLAGSSSHVLAVRDMPTMHLCTSCFKYDSNGWPSRHSFWGTPGEGHHGTTFAVLQPAPTAPEFLGALVRFTHVLKGPTCAFSYDDARELDMDQLLPVLHDLMAQYRAFLTDPGIEEPTNANHRRMQELVEAHRRLSQAQQKYNWKWLRKCVSAGLHLASSPAAPAIRGL